MQYRNLLQHHVVRLYSCIRSNGSSIETLQPSAEMISYAKCNADDAVEKFQSIVMMATSCEQPDAARHINSQMVGTSAAPFSTNVSTHLPGLSCCVTEISSFDILVGDDNVDLFVTMMMETFMTVFGTKVLSLSSIRQWLTDNSHQEVTYLKHGVHNLVDGGSKKQKSKLFDL